ncbi:MAG TPA: hypothetical protein ENN89_02320 [Synergistetes bacterium]|nr:hypothetical protein [Synergistota bacterium]
MLTGGSCGMGRTGSNIPKTMKAVVKKEPGPGAVFEEYLVPSPGPGDVLVEIKAAAICGTDAHIYGWNSWASGAMKNFPQVMGHEFCGEVVAVGEMVGTVKVGDKVAGETHGPCGKCFQCQNGLRHICANMILFGVNCDGCFAQYAVLPEICARPIPQEIPWELGAIMEPLGTSIRSAIEVGSQGTNILVAGAGPDRAWLRGCAEGLWSGGYYCNGPVFLQAFNSPKGRSRYLYRPDKRRSGKDHQRQDQFSWS